MKCSFVCFLQLPMNSLTLASNTGKVIMASMIYFSIITISINNVFIYYVQT